MVMMRWHKGIVQYFYFLGIRWVRLGCVWLQRSAEMKPEETAAVYLPELLTNLLTRRSCLLEFTTLSRLGTVTSWQILGAKTLFRRVITLFLQGRANCFFFGLSFFSLCQDIYLADRCASDIDFSIYCLDCWHKSSFRIRWFIKKNISACDWASVGKVTSI